MSAVRTARRTNHPRTGKHGSRLLEPLAVIATNEKATPSLVYRALLKSMQDGSIVPGAKLPNERDLAMQLNTSRTAVRTALSMMEREGLIRRKVGSGTFLTDDADRVFEKMDRITVGSHDKIPSFLEIIEGRLLFEPAMMQLVINRAEPWEIEDMRQNLEELLAAASWREFKESIYALYEKIFSATKNRFLVQIMESIVYDRRAVVFDGKDTDLPPPDGVRQHTYRELGDIVEAIAEAKVKRAQELVTDHLMRTLATINIWQ
jgi:DNA-binding FadR family transcriptional regulator